MKREYYAKLTNYQYGAYPFRHFQKNITKEVKLDSNHRIVFVELEDREAEHLNSGIAGNYWGKVFKAKSAFSYNGIIKMLTK